MNPELFYIFGYAATLFIMVSAMTAVSKGFTGNKASGDNVLQANFSESPINRLGRRFSIWRQNQRAIRELHSMSDDVLRDLGIERYEIEARVTSSSKAALQLKPAKKQKQEPQLRRAA